MNFLMIYYNIPIGELSYRMQALDKTLTDIFIEGIKSPSSLQVGVEWEKIGVYRDTGKAIPYSGDRGVEAILKALASKYGWLEVLSDGHIIALQKNRSSITLEPGGQIELSGATAPTILENALELYQHLSEIKNVSEPLGIVWLGLGLQPISRLDEIEWVPKKRYGIMREYLKNRGPLTHSMMKKTASIQVSIDYTSEKDAIEKLRLATALAPVFSAIFANSPVSEGKITGDYSTRCEIWRQTDPDRTGLVERIFDPSFNFESYAEYALDVPMFFIIRDDRWIPMGGIPFRQFIEKGFEGHTASNEDWRLHLTTIFTEVRLKNYIEIRSMDCQKKELGLSAPALIKGLFYNEKARKEAAALVKSMDAAERARLMREVPKKGLYTAFNGGTLWDLAGKLVPLAEKGLEAMDRPFLASLKELLFVKKKMPAEVLLQCFQEDAPEKIKIESLVNCAAL